MRKTVAVCRIQGRTEARQAGQETIEQSAQGHAMRRLSRWPLGSPIHLIGGDVRQQVFGALNLLGQFAENQRWKPVRSIHNGGELPYSSG